MRAELMQVFSGPLTHANVHNRSWIRPYSAQHDLLNLLGWFVRWEVSCHTISVLWDVAFRFCLKQLLAFLCSYHLVFSSTHFLNIQEVHPYSRIDTTIVLKNSLFILSGRSNFHMIDSLSIAFPSFARRILNHIQ